MFHRTRGLQLAAGILIMTCAAFGQTPPAAGSDAGGSRPRPGR